MFVLGILIYIVVLSIAMSFSSRIGYFADLPIFLMIIGFNIAVLIATKSFKDLKDVFIDIFSTARISESAKLNRGISIINLLIKVTIVSGFIGGIIGFISMLTRLSNPSSIGPHMATILLSFLYSLSIAFFLLLPARFILEKKKESSRL